MRHACVSEVLHGIRREKGVAQVGKAALLTADVRTMIERLPNSLLGKRDAALLLLGYAGGFRRSELAGLLVSDIEFCEEGLRVHLRRSKTDQEGQGRKIGIPYGSDPQTCPVRALRRWLTAAGIVEGALFRAVMHGRVSEKAFIPQVVALVVKRHCKAAGLDYAKFAAHSLRAGLCTQSALNGASERSIMKQTGHRSVQMVRRYIREGSLFRENSAGKLGL
jgi:integrase